MDEPRDFEFLQRLLGRHAPCFYLPSINQCRYAFPSSFEWFLRASEVRCARRGTLLRESVCPASLVETLEDAAVEGIRLELKSRSARFGDRTMDIDDIPIYASIKAVCDENGAIKAWELTYVTYFAFNGAYFFDLFGSHTGDIEHLTVRCHPDGRLSGVWYNSHRNVDGMWVAAPDVEIDSSGRLVSYVAASGHGHYPREGRYWRHYGFANDITSRDVRWLPKVVVWVEPGIVHPVMTTHAQDPQSNAERETVRIEPIAPPRVDMDGTQAYIVHEKIISWGGAPGLGHQSWFRDKTEPTRSRAAYERFFTFPFHFLPPGENCNEQ